MKEKKRKESQTQSEASASGDLNSNSQKIGHDSESLENTSKAEIESETKIAAPEARQDLADEELNTPAKKVPGDDDRENDSAKPAKADGQKVRQTSKANPVNATGSKPNEEETQTEPADAALVGGELDEKNVGAVVDTDVVEKTQSEQNTGAAEGQSGDHAGKEKPEKSANKISPVKAAVSAVLILAVFCGFFLFDNKSKIKSIKKEKAKVIQNKKISLKKQKKNQLIHPAKKSGNRYDTKIKEIRALRETLLHKQQEVQKLKKKYRKGITELENEISDERQRTQISTFLQAMQNKRIEFALQTIQRRQAYIQQLEGPSNWILQASEELLYIKRRTTLDLQVAEIAAGIDMKRHVRRINAALEKYRPTADKLAIDMTDAPFESLETIWEQIENQRLQKPSVRSYSKNQIIFEQICSGNFKDLTELTEMTAEAAGCITELPGSDLFLNGLTEISPAAARRLFKWNGSWICLNGIEALSPRVARYLFQWDGRWISLNGLTEFPAEVGEALLQWDGKQLELMGLRDTDDSPAKIGIEYLAQWERSGGRLFVPARVRKKLDTFNRQSARTQH